MSIAPQVGRRRLLRCSLAGTAATFVSGIAGLFSPPVLDAGERLAAQQEIGGGQPGSIETLLAEREIRRLMSLYARACDERRWDLADQIFAPDVESSFNPGKGRQGVVDSWKQHLGGCGPTQHLMGSMLIDVNGVRATSRTYVRAFHRGKGEKAKLLWDLTGEYSSEWQRRPEGWRATRWVLRTITSEGSMSVLGPE
jgi:hypothetical protein